MESKNAKSVKKTIKASRKAAAKDLEINLASRFLEVVKGLGHSTKKISQEIQKSSKKISKELAKTISEVLEPAQEKRLPKGSDGKSNLQKSASAKKAPRVVAKKELVKAKKVVSRAGTGKKGELNSKGILTASTQVSTPREEDLSTQPETVSAPPAVKESQSRVQGLSVGKNNEDVVSPS